MKKNIITILLITVLLTGCGYNAATETAPLEQSGLNLETSAEVIAATSLDREPQMAQPKHDNDDGAAYTVAESNTPPAKTNHQDAIMESLGHNVYEQDDQEVSAAADQQDALSDTTPAVTYIPTEIASNAPAESAQSNTVIPEPEPVFEVVTELEPAVEPYPQPAAAVSADLDAIMASANAYAAFVYGCAIDPALNMGNSSYRYPAYVAADADQATVEAKAQDIVDFTFGQLMRQNGVTLERFMEAGIRCNVYAYRDGDTIFLYCLYA